MLNLAGHEYQERSLVRAALRGMRGTSRYGQERWILVMELFGLGSTVARALCREFEMDPDEVLKK